MKDSDMELVPIYTVSVESEDGINEKIDSEIKKRFLGRHICIRVLGSSVHNGKTLDEVIEKIQETGTDRYDPSIRSERYDNNENRNIDFFALDFDVHSRSEMFSDFVWRKKLRPPLEIDILIIYDIDQIERVLYSPIGRMDTKYDGFAFKDPLRKNKALEAIFRIMR